MESKREDDVRKRWGWGGREGDGRVRQEGRLGQAQIGLSVGPSFAPIAVVEVEHAAAEERP